MIFQRVCRWLDTFVVRKYTIGNHSHRMKILWNPKFSSRWKRVGQYVCAEVTCLPDLRPTQLSCPRFYEQTQNCTSSSQNFQYHFHKSSLLWWHTPGYCYFTLRITSWRIESLQYVTCPSCALLSSPPRSAPPTSCNCVLSCRIYIIHNHSSVKFIDVKLVLMTAGIRSLWTMCVEIWSMLYADCDYRIFTLVTSLGSLFVFFGKQIIKPIP